MMILFGCAQILSLFLSFYIQRRLKNLGACNIYEGHLSCPVVVIFFEVATFVKGHLETISAKWF